MGYMSRNDPPPPDKSEENPWLEENEFMDETALLISGDARKCRKCKRAARTKHLDTSGRCPDCRD